MISILHAGHVDTLQLYVNRFDPELIWKINRNQRTHLLFMYMFSRCTQGFPLGSSGFLQHHKTR